jgi:tRNA (guanine-N7-)-methyltransferase
MNRVLKDYPSVSLMPEALAGKIDFVNIFGRCAPVHIEIGSGRGTFLLNQARENPVYNFLGIEWASRYYRYAVDRIGRWGLSNVRIIRTEAASFISDFVCDNSVDYFHVYFPDPWPKKRHHKRRFLCHVNLENLVRCLKTGGQLGIATDHADYFEQVKLVLAGVQEKLDETDFLPAAGADTGEWVGTNFERKYLKEQRKIYTIALRKKQDANQCCYAGAVNRIG